MVSIFCYLSIRCSLVPCRLYCLCKVCFPASRIRGGGVKVPIFCYLSVHTSHLVPCPLYYRVCSAACRMRVPLWPPPSPQTPSTSSSGLYLWTG